MSRSRLLAGLLLPLLLMACGSFTPVPVDRQPDASLLLPCRPPKLPPQSYTDTDVALSFMDAHEKYLECEAKQNALAAFVKGGKVEK